MHIVAHGLEVTIATAVERNGLMAAAEEVTESLRRRLNRAVYTPKNHFMPSTKLAFGVSMTK